MWVEDKETKIVREAKRKAHGECPYHNGHFKWEDWWVGLMTSVAVALIVFGGYSIVSEHTESTKQRADNVGWQRGFNDGTAAHGLPSGNLSITTCNENGCQAEVRP